MQLEILKACTAAITALGVAYFGLRIYFRQKEYEIVKQRYLEQSLDVVCSDLEAMTSALSHNWAHCLEVVRGYRDSPSTLKTGEINRGFVPLNASRFNRIAQHRLQTLVGSNVFWSVYQLALSKHMALNNMVTGEIPHAISAHVEGKIQAIHQDVVQTAIAELEPVMTKSDYFAPLVGALYRVSSVLERERLNFRSVGRFAKKPEIVAIVKEVSEHYASDLKDAP